MNAIQPAKIGWLQPLFRRMTMASGTVKWFNPTKGFGFIQPDDGSKDVFVHVSSVEKAGIRSLQEGHKLEFEIDAGRPGRASAIDLRV
jgi:CspA family cold shock protein